MEYIYGLSNKKGKIKHPILNRYIKTDEKELSKKDEVKRFDCFDGYVRHVLEDLTTDGGYSAGINSIVINYRREIIFVQCINNGAFFGKSGVRINTMREVLGYRIVLN